MLSHALPADCNAGAVPRANVIRRAAARAVAICRVAAIEILAGGARVSVCPGGRRLIIIALHLVAARYNCEECESRY